jgi:hypothetical protein
MANLFLKIFVEHLNFNDDKTSIISEVKNYYCSMKSLNLEYLDVLRDSVLKIKGDWISFKCSYFNDTYYVDMYLIFHYKELTKDDENIIQNVFKQCEKFLSDYNSQPLDNNINNLEKLTEITETNGFIINILDEFSDLQLDYEKIEKVLTEDNIKFKPLNITKTNFEGGAGIDSQEFFYFIMTSVASGITWDFIKHIFQTNFSIPLQSSTIKFIEKHNFSKLRKDIADKIGDEEKHLILEEMIKKPSKTNLKFRTEDKKIEIECDKNYNIKKFKSENINK